MPNSRNRRRKTAKKSTRARATAKPAYPAIIVFDVDGVLVDTRESFHRTAIETVRFFTKKPVTLREFHAWKNRPGFNDDWILCTTWVKELGFDVTFSQIKRKFQQLYWGKNGHGFVLGERWLLSPAALRRLGRRSQLAIFTGRYYREMDYTLDRNKVRNLFSEIMTVERAKRPKPAPDGLLKILAGRDPSTALYLGDTIDDALAAKAAKVPFVGVLPRDGEERRQRGATLKRLGALTILGRVNELEDWLQKRFRP
ncbi:MAG TPA: HAD hydrolase-like protein [Candidatus Acidoferrum sp.]|nr:HAD hydrolase-like protein [Candidatus Acidoferrum sp.]